VSRDRYLATPPAPAPAAGCTSSGRPLPTTAHPSREPFWHDAAAIFGPEEGSATQRRPLSHLTWPIETAPTEARAAPRAGPALGRRRLGPSRRRRSRRRTGGRAGSIVRGMRSRATRGSATPRSGPARRGAPCSARPEASASGTAPPPGSSSGSSTRRRSTRRRTRSYAGSSPTRRCTPSTRGCRRSSASTASRPRRSEPALRFLERCLEDTIGSGVRLELGEVDSAELRESLRRDLVRFVRAEAESSSRSCRGGSRSASARTARRRSSSAGSRSATGCS
jgi:hypothetical protein